MTLTANQLAPAAKRRQRLTEICQAFPQVAVEVAGNDHLAFRVNKRIFAYYLFDHHGDGRIAFCRKSILSEQRRQVRDDPDNFFVPPYLGAKGWIAIRLDADEVDWEIVSDLARGAARGTVTRK